jgi:cytosine/adenosine deaminase-related metal-dependent hydrolase
VPSAAGLNPDRRADLADEIADLRHRLACIEAELGLGSPGLAQDGRDPFAEGHLTLQRAAGAWGVTDEAARKRALRLASLGMAERRRPGGWRISTAGVRFYLGG